MIKNHDLKRRRFLELCEKKGLRITPQRTIIYEELIKAQDHPSVDALYKRVRKTLPNISFDTVYRTLISFSDLGIVRTVEGYGELKRFDPDIDNHHHLRCIKCQKIIDFCNETYNALKIPVELTKGFTIMSKREILEGVCKDCSKRG